MPGEDQPRVGAVYPLGHQRRHHHLDRVADEEPAVGRGGRRASRPAAEARQRSGPRRFMTARNPLRAPRIAPASITPSVWKVIGTPVVPTLMVPGAPRAAISAAKIAIWARSRDVLRPMATTASPGSALVTNGRRRPTRCRRLSILTFEAQPDNRNRPAAPLRGPAPDSEEFYSRETLTVEGRPGRCRHDGWMAASRWWNQNAVSLCPPGFEEAPITGADPGRERAALLINGFGSNGPANWGPYQLAERVCTVNVQIIPRSRSNLKLSCPIHERSRRAERFDPSQSGQAAFGQGGAAKGTDCPHRPKVDPLNDRRDPSRPRRGTSGGDRRSVPTVAARTASVPTWVRWHTDRVRRARLRRWKTSARRCRG